jgi:hypothetical protein
VTACETRFTVGVTFEDLPAAGQARHQGWLKRQSLSRALEVRHEKLFGERTPPEKRLRTIIKGPKE